MQVGGHHHAPVALSLGFEDKGNTKFDVILTVHRR